MKVANSFPNHHRRHAYSRRTWERVTTTPSSTSSTWNTVAADDSGTEDVTETRIDSTRPKTAKMFARCPKERTDAICRRLPDRALDITRCGITIRTGIRALSSRTVDAWAMPTGSRRSRNARAPALWMIRCVSSMSRVVFLDRNVEELFLFQHLAINQWKLDRATERLHAGTTKRNVTLANHSCMEAARATRTTTQRRVPVTTTARNLEFTSVSTSSIALLMAVE